MSPSRTPSRARPVPPAAGPPGSPPASPSPRPPRCCCPAAVSSGPAPRRWSATSGSPTSRCRRWWTSRSPRPAPGRAWPPTSAATWRPTGGPCSGSRCAGCSPRRSAARLGIEVPESEVEARYRSAQQQAGSAEAFAAQLAAQPISPTLFRELVRTEVIEAEIGYQQGGARRLTESQLRAAYQAVPADRDDRQPHAHPAAGRRDHVAPGARPGQGRPVGLRLDRRAVQPAADAAAAAGPRAEHAARRPGRPAAADRARHDFAYQLSNGDAQAFFVIRFGGIKRPTLQSARPQLVAQSVRQARAGRAEVPSPGRRTSSASTSARGTAPGPRTTWRSASSSTR